MLHERSVAIYLLGLTLFACAGTQPQPAAPEPAPESASPSGAKTTGAARPELTAQACEAGGGTVVGDIGDGAIHRADYMCPNGLAPTGSIRAPEGGPVAIEGSICCPK